MEVVSTSETSFNIYQTTRRNIPEDSHLHLFSIFTVATKRYSSVDFKTVNQAIDQSNDLEISLISSTFLATYFCALEDA
jgi:hypothetical protein